ncbi:MAG: phytoene/squalene synthase family protein [Thermoplasmatota archaeon]
MVPKKIFETFKAGSRTYFYSSLFFPRQLREDVFRLYAFVRTADNFVDVVPQQPEEFYAFRQRYEEALEGHTTGDVIVDHFAALLERRNFDPSWVEAFLDSMEMDLEKRCYATMHDLLEYIYGSAEVIGLMMARIMRLPDKALPAAQLLGRSMQYINFIRDIEEDLKFGRIYFPLDMLHQHGLTTLDEQETHNNPEGFIAFVREQIAEYCEWQASAEKGFRYIPKRYLIPVKTASEMYKWTARKIQQDPFIVYRTKVKPMVPYIVGTVVRNLLAKPLKVESCSR